MEFLINKVSINQYGTNYSNSVFDPTAGSVDFPLEGFYDEIGIYLSIPINTVCCS